MAFRFRRGTDLERQSITPKLGEPLYVTDTGQVYVGDGTTQGGILVSGEVVTDDSPSLGGNLDLAGNNIFGTGNIDIDGYINATGNINLGDGAEDNIIVGGVIESSLIPGQDGAYDLGDSTSKWRSGFFEGLDIDGEISANSLSVNNIYSTDSTSIYEATTQTFLGNINGSLIGDESTVIIDNTDSSAFLSTVNAEEIIADSITGNLVGSVFSDTSNIVVNGLDGSVTAEQLTTSFFNPENGSATFTFDTAGTGQDAANLELTSTGESSAFFVTDQPDVTLPADYKIGRVEWRAIDQTGLDIPALMQVRKTEFVISVGDFSEGNTFKINRNTGNYGLGKEPSTAKVNVGGEIVADGFVQTGSYTEAERDNLTPANGMILYNTTANKFQGYENGSWVNLI